MTTINIFTDGASRGNPGDAGIGAIIYENKIILEEISGFLGKKTNNEAEYLAVVLAFEKILELKNKGSLKNIEKVNLFADSQFLIKQLKKEYKVKAEKIIPLYNKTNNLIKQLDFNFTYNWIPRSENSIADLLANKGIDEKNLIKLNIGNSSETNISNNNNNKNLNNRINNNNSLSNYNLDNSIILERAFFGKINCFKIQMNKKNEIYFHIGLLNSKINNWNWIKVKMNDIELAQISYLLEKEDGKCSFFHSFENSKTQIWCNKSPTSFSIKIKDISKNLSLGEFQVFRILLNECIIRSNFI